MYKTDTVYKFLVIYAVVAAGAGGALHLPMQGSILRLPSIYWSTISSVTLALLCSRVSKNWDQTFSSLTSWNAPTNSCS